MNEPYAFTVSTNLSADVVRTLMAAYRPFRVEVNFDNGFSTSQFGDQTVYPSKDPLAKAHYFPALLQGLQGRKVLDIGCHLGYWGHYLLERGATRYVGVELDERTLRCAQIIQALSKHAAGPMHFQRLDFSVELAIDDPTQFESNDLILSLASINNVENLLIYLRNIRRLAGERADLVIEYLATENEEAIVEFYSKGYRHDKSLRWIFSERFIDEQLCAIGFTKAASLLNWQNEELIGKGVGALLASANIP